MHGAQQRRYGGGQECPSCERILGAADRYCRWCGERLNPGSGENIPPEDKV